ncbi:MAG: hypothetical protein IM574_02825 [Cytophagales bacterium]|jgi:hypothetical protein|nr:hypothetical protein [Cytophagales bacterium]MCA6386531.1 hypothetical protein [Cytophagales bacterium]MCA6389959.1 hypothetical protein [Cytophagales bacterium]MCA6395092.1 hypothetical protein [Cytophagales bacterium]MCA6398119.1 hypothetical protein [Cytophagales bacterium]
MITRAIENCLRSAKEKGWDKTYWAFDIHGTILKPNYKRDEISREFYPGAIEVMKVIAKRNDIVKILYTCSYPHEIEQYLEYFAQQGIHFDYINQNPEITDGGYGYYKDKFYFNVLMDDKAGFDGESDWENIKGVLGYEKI